MSDCELITLAMLGFSVIGATAAMWAESYIKDRYRLVRKNKVKPKAI